MEDSRRGFRRSAGQRRGRDGDVGQKELTMSHRTKACSRSSSSGLREFSGGDRWPVGVGGGGREEGDGEGGRNGGPIWRRLKTLSAPSPSPHTQHTPPPPPPPHFRQRTSQCLRHLLTGFTFALENQPPSPQRTRTRTRTAPAKPRSCSVREQKVHAQPQGDHRG